MREKNNKADVHRLVREIYARGGVGSEVCHGPCALANVQLSNMDYLIKGKQLVSFTNQEEIESGSNDVVPCMLETELTNHKAVLQGKGNWSDNVVVDGRLITGQNPQ